VGLILPFQDILRDCLSNVPGSLAALFLDHEGESVAIATEGCSLHDAKIIGAYAGIFLSRMERIVGAMGQGSTLRLKLDFERASILTSFLRDGYYLVLVLGPESLEGRAWRRMDRTREALLREM
jgi:predicted regulator of Ras-like GTPase activity (Roadblock/LC7/MglB family)